MHMYYTSHGPTSQGKNIVVKAAKYSRENLEGGIITFICIRSGASAVSSSWGKIQTKFTLYLKNPWAYFINRL